jgi:hypothetical protein
LLVFDGQSLNGVPGPGASYPHKLLARLDPKPERADVWTNGRSWADLETDAGARLSPLVIDGRPTVLLMCGGQSDLLDGVDGHELLDLEMGYAAGARDAGVDSVVIFTIVPSTAYSASVERARRVHNRLLLDHPGGTFDGVVDVAGIASLADPSDRTYYMDGLHWRGPATTLVSEAALVVVQPILAAWAAARTTGA